MIMYLDRVALTHVALSDVMGYLQPHQDVPVCLDRDEAAVERVKLLPIGGEYETAL